MKLGAYEFEWVPDEMDIPRPEKTVSVQENLGNVGYFSWGPQLIGKEVKMKWKFASVAQYEAFRALYLAGGVHVLDLSSSTVYFAPPSVGGLENFMFQPYPDPSYPGVLPGPPYKRYHFGYVHGGASFVLDNYMFQGWDPIHHESGYIYNGYAKLIDFSNPLASFVDMGPESYYGLHFPDWEIGDTVYDNDYVIWATVVPWDPDLRAYHLYPAVPSATDKIYYSDVINDSFPYADNVLNVGDVVRLPDDTYPTAGRVSITELGTDDIGTWFRCEAVPGYRLIQWTAGNVTFITGKQFNIAPWGPITGGPYG